MTRIQAKPWEPWPCPEAPKETEHWVRLGPHGKILGEISLYHNGSVWYTLAKDPLNQDDMGITASRSAVSVEYAKKMVDQKLVELRIQLLNYQYEYPRRASAVDAVVFGVDQEGLKILLIQRQDDPFAGSWALPGGFIDEALKENADQAVRREMQEETGIENIYLEQLYTFSDPDRDPREPVLSLSYYALVKPEDLSPKAGSDARDVRWFLVSDLPDLAFDHATIIQTGLDRLRGKVRYQPVGFELLPRKFTLSRLQALYEAILGRKLDKRNFRKKALSLGILTGLDEHQATVEAGRHPRLYRFDSRQYRKLVKAGFDFAL